MDRSSSEQGLLEESNIVMASTTTPEVVQQHLPTTVTMMQLQPQGLAVAQPHFTITSAGYPSIPPPQYGYDPSIIPSQQQQEFFSSTSLSTSVPGTCQLIGISQHSGAAGGASYLMPMQQHPILQTSVSGLQIPAMAAPPPEVEQTSLSIKQRAAELTKKTRNSFRRKNTSTSNSIRVGRKRMLPRERKSNVDPENKKTDDMDDNSSNYAESDGLGFTAFLLTALSVFLILVTVPFSLCLVVKVVAEYERAVIFRLGRLRKGGSKGPGIFTVIPCIDTYRCVDLRTVSFDVPPQEILTCDSVTVSVDAVVYFNVIDAEQALCSVDDFSHSTRLLAATTLRNVLGTKNLAEILSERETISHIMQSSLDEATDPWGVKVERVEIKDVRLPVQLQRAMAAEAEAAREARAKVIAAEGEQKASFALKEAASVIQQSPSALQLRYLQTLNSIAAEHNSTIIFPMPISMLSGHLFQSNDSSNDSS